MKIGYDISINPASVAFFSVIENPMHNSARINNIIPPITYKSNFLDEAISNKSGRNLFVKKEIVNVTRKTTSEAIAREVVTEIFLYTCSLKTYVSPQKTDAPSANKIYIPISLSYIISFIDFFAIFGILSIQINNIGESSNGRTSDFGSDYLGSNPSSPATLS